MKIPNWFLRTPKFEEEREKELLEQELKQLEEESKQQEEAEKPKEMMDVYVRGEYNFKVIERERYWNHQSHFVVEFKYTANVKFLDEEITSKGDFHRGIDYVRDRRIIVSRNPSDDEERTYEYLAEMLKSKEGQEEIMDAIKNGISQDIVKHVRKKNIEAIKKEIEENANRQFQFTFEVEKIENE